MSTPVPDTRPFRVLAVCTANICRSPVMEHLLRARLDPQHYTVDSAGVRGFRARPVDPDAVGGLLARGIDPSDFRSKRLDPRLAGEADLVLTATRRHRSAVLALAPEALRRTFTLRELAGLVDLVDAPTVESLLAEAARERSRGPADADIEDPYQQGPEVHAAVAAQIDAAVDAVARALSTRPPR